MLEAVINAVATVGGVADDYFDNVSLLLSMDGADGSTTFTDATGKSVTSVGNAQISTAQSKFGGASAYVDGVGDYISVANHTNFDFGSGDFTIEGWFRSDATLGGSGVTGQRVLFSKWSPGSYSFICDAVGGELRFITTSTPTTSGSLNIASATATLAAGVWYHIACVRDGANLRLFLNGVQLNSVAAGFVGASTASLAIGYKLDGAGSEYFNGNIDDFRITKGVARYTAAFTPPSAAFPAGALSAGAALTTNISLAAATAAASSVTAALSTSIAASALLAGEATLSGTLTASSASLAASVGAVSTVSGWLDSEGVALDASIAAQAQVSADLTTAAGIGLMAIIQASASASASLSTAIKMTADLVASAQASAAFWQFGTVDLPDDWLIYVLTKPQEKTVLRLPDERAIFTPSDDLTVAFLDGVQVLEAAR